ncbi:RNA-directed DNA polymerase [Lysinibacillus sp. RC46]|uniref:group II intron reverse transcriptase/maturase n=1 Tax=unclassified Lysinibacillus TaxID=2636778 RepID=UPI0035161C60
MKVKGQGIISEAGLNNLLDNMYALSRKRDEPFYNLVELAMNRQVILTAIHNIKSNKGSKTAGIDKKDIDVYLQMDFEKLVSLINKTLSNYNPLPVRRKYIPKSNGRRRALGIPTMLDRVIQEIVKITIEPILEAKFFKHSYGFRPYRSAEHAIARIIDLVRRGKNYYIVEGDIEGFFDNINHNKLIELLWNMGIRDKRMLAIIKKMLKAGVMEDDKSYKTDMGTPQGGIISPLLANVYLNGLDHLIADEWENHLGKGTISGNHRNIHRHLRYGGHEPCWFVRYADDWVILCDSMDRAERILKKADKYLNHVLKLKLSQEKTLITDIRKNRARFLGFEIMAEKARMRDIVVGKAIPNIKKLDEKVAEVLKDVNKLKLFKNDYDRAVSIEKINAKIVGIGNYYAISNYSYLFRKLDGRLDYRTFKTFRNIYGKDKVEAMRFEAEQVRNRIDRHKGIKTKVYAVNVDDVNIGLTRFSFTKSRKAMNFNQNITPYTAEGRKINEIRSKTKLKLDRPTIYNVNDLEFVALHQIKPSKKSDKLYNFEYMMNREYAYNRDKGKCKCCKVVVAGFNVHCHHINKFLPMEKINKVMNLATICKGCHSVIHNKNLSVVDASVMKKINKYRDKLTKTNTSLEKSLK